MLYEYDQPSSIERPSQRTYDVIGERLHERTLISHDCRVVAVALLNFFDPYLVLSSGFRILFHPVAVLVNFK